MKKKINVLWLFRFNGTSQMALNDLRATHTWTHSTVIVGRCAYAYAYTLHSMASLVSFTLVFLHIFHLFVSFMIFSVSFRILLLCEHISLFDSINWILFLSYILVDVVFLICIRFGISYDFDEWLLIGM